MESATPFESVDFQPFSFNADDRVLLERQLEAAHIEPARFPECIRALEFAVGMFKSARESKAAGAHAADVRKLLKQSERALSRLDESLEQLDTALGRYCFGSSGVSLDTVRHTQVARMREVLDKALSAVPDASGRPQDLALLFLLQNIGDAMRAKLGKEPTSTRGGLYECLIAIVLEAATGEEPGEPNALAERGITLFR